MRLGENQPRYSKIFLIAATNKDLKTEIAEGRFREDLYHRLAVILIKVPALNDRREDIPLLVDFFTKKISDEQGAPQKTFSDEAIEMLKKYDWTGNIRELRNFCENIIILKQGQTLIHEDLDAKFFKQDLGDQSQDSISSENRSLNSNFSLDMNEKQLLRNALLKCGGNRTKAAQLMGISRRTLHRKLLKWPELLLPEVLF